MFSEQSIARIFKTVKTKNCRILIYFLIVAAAIVILPTSISKMKLHQEQLSFSNINSSYIENSRPVTFEGIPKFMYITLGILIILGLIHFMVTGGVRGILTIAVFVLVFYLLVNYMPEKTELSSLPPSLPVSGVAIPKSTTEPSHWFVYLVSLAACGFVLLVCIVILRWMKKRLSPGAVIIREAQKALDDLKSGVDLKAGVIRCYSEMVNALAKYHSLHRSKTMTAREFEGYLAQAGFASSDIRRLTRLFEKVRYGGQNLGKNEEQEAVGCLETIIRYCEDVQ